MHVEPFVVGSSVIRRDIWFGKVWSAWPARVVDDDGQTLTFVVWPGVNGLVTSRWVTWFQSGDRTIRDQFVGDLSSRSWELAHWAWQSNICLRQVVGDRWFAVTAFFEYQEHRFKYWYVDFEKAPMRTRSGIDTRDLFLDLVVLPDFSYRWKDEEEYDRALKLGLLSDHERREVESARAEALESIQAHTLMRGHWDNWRLDESWALPALPPEVLADAGSCV
jgi:predicted RNA-binding protein associated with RNAse of E/G family